MEERNNNFKNNLQKEFRTFDKEIQKLEGLLEVARVERENIKREIDRIFKALWGIVVIQLVQAVALIWKTLGK